MVFDHFDNTNTNGICRYKLSKSKINAVHCFKAGKSHSSIEEHTLYAVEATIPFTAKGANKMNYEQDDSQCK
jgi:hypothetical protein